MQCDLETSKAGGALGKQPTRRDSKTLLKIFFILRDILASSALCANLAANDASNAGDVAHAWEMWGYDGKSRERTRSQKFPKGSEGKRRAVKRTQSVNFPCYFREETVPRELSPNFPCYFCEFSMTCP